MQPVRRVWHAARRLVDWRPGRGTARAALLILPVAGAGLGAVLGDAPDAPFQAEADLAFDRGSPGVIASDPRLLNLDRVMEPVRERARVGGSLAELRERITFEGEPTTGRLTVTARGTTPAGAVRLADAVVSEATTLSDQIAAEAQGGVALVLGDFESGIRDWNAQASAFNVPPSSAQTVVGDARYRSAALEVDCPAQLACGPWLKIRRVFRPDTVYTASGWVRAPRGRPRVALILGAGSGNLQGTRPIPLRRAWRRFEVSWSPTAPASSAEVAFQLQDRRATRFQVDGVVLGDVTLQAERELFRRPPLPAGYVVIGPARATGRVANGTVSAALVGGALGLAFAVAAVAFGVAAARREPSR